MLKSLDVLIGFSVIMLVASLAVTYFTQLVAILLNSRGKNLLQGLTQLIHRADPAMKEEYAKEIADAVLTHPLVADPSGKPGSVIQREELIRILLELAGSATSVSSLSDAAREALRSVLQRSGITDPAATLRNINSMVLQLESTSPSLASHVRTTMAIARMASCDFVDHITNRFDAGMARVSQSFRANMALYSSIFALLLALAAQLDVIRLLNQLALDEGLRKTLVTEAPGVPALQGNASAVPEVADQAKELRSLAAATLLVPPARWVDQWNWWKLPGILVATLLMTLGAPFWFDLLSNLLRLRPALAVTEDAERRDRQAAQPAAPAATLPPGGTGGTA